MVPGDVISEIVGGVSKNLCKFSNDDIITDIKNS